MVLALAYLGTQIQGVSGPFDGFMIWLTRCAAKYPLLMNADIDTLSKGLSQNEFTSVDLVKVRNTSISNELRCFP